MFVVVCVCLSCFLPFAFLKASPFLAKLQKKIGPGLNSFNF